MEVASRGGPVGRHEEPHHVQPDVGAAAQALTLRIGISRLDSERPGVSANGGTTQYGVITTQADARGVSLGSWRGNNAIYAYNFAANTLNVGLNTFDIYAISGSSFTGYFSGYHIYDAIDLIPRYVTGTTSNVTAPAVTSLTISPAAGTNVGVLGSRVFSVLGSTVSGTRAVNAVWTATRGTINDAGEYVAPSTAGTDTVTATVGSVSASITINVVVATPTIVTPATASPAITFTKSTTLTALGDDDGGEANLKYTWSVVGTPPGTVTFGATNGTNAAKSITATFSAYGTYTLQTTIADASGNSTVSQTTVVAKNDRLWLKLDQPNGQAITDSSGMGSTGVVYGRYEFPTGVGSGALKLTGGAATLPTGIVAGLNDFTIATWVKPDALNNWARIFDFGTGQTSYMFLTARAGTTGTPLRFAITTSGGAGEQKLDGPTLAQGVWTHVAVTLSGTAGTLYVNGAAVATGTINLKPSSLGTTTANFIGESQFTSDPTFLGTIDDFRIYGHALTGTEVSALAKPTVATAAAASPSPVTGTTTALSVLGADVTGGASSLTYTWSTVGTPPAAVTFSANGTNDSRLATATFTKAGTYTLRATITNAGGQSVTSDVTIVVNQTLSGVTISPDPTTVGTGATRGFTATGFDQFGQPIATLPSAPVWSVQSGGGSISQNGVYTAPATTGSAIVKATVGAFTKTAAITIVDLTPPTITLGSFLYETGQSIVLNFSEDVLASLSVGDLVVTNLTTGATIPASSFTLSTTGTATVATWSRNLATDGMLPDGNYRATFAAGNASDAAGNSNALAYNMDFFVLAGDVNRDHTVNFTDLLVLAANYGSSGRTYSQGDLNYDGSVDFGDLLILAAKYGTTLAGTIDGASAASQAVEKASTITSVAQDVLA
ncbi:MAG: polysaccharide lyase family protein [Tepidisphaeraceae bacterium]